jgi:malto-oligosyltrehalose trehalohydrolase/4-alpha-glucanotransferase
MGLLPRYVASQRWYAAKDAGMPEVRIVDAVPLAVDGGLVQLCILRTQAPGLAGPQHYFLPLMLDRANTADAWRVAGPEDGPWAGAVRDAFGDDNFVRMLVNGISRGATVDGLVFGRSSAWRLELNGPVVCGRSGVEQSNTSVRIGDGAILKGFRKLEAGVHPELEMARFLTEVTGFPGTPPLLGWVERRGNDGMATTLAVLQGLVPEAEDGWSYVTGRLARRLAAFGAPDGDPDGDPGGAPDGEPDGDSGGAADDRDLLARLGGIGRRTAELHRALAMPGGDPAFAIERVDARAMREWGEGVRLRARQVLEQLDAALPRLDDETRAVAASLVACRGAIEAQIDALIPASAHFARMRLHGDFHLGQVLVAPGEIFIIDFEGEPMRPLAERRVKHCALRDVAGFLRSLAYVAAAMRRALRADNDGAGNESAGKDGARRAAQDAWIGWWEGQAQAAFLDGYRGAIGDCPGFPAEPGAAAGLLKLFLLEKALYEVAYELANRPDWLAIPLAGVLALLGADAGPDMADRRPGPIGQVAPGAVAGGCDAHAHAMPFGAQPGPDGAVRFALWAPAAASVSVVLEDGDDGTGAAIMPMVARGDGWHALSTARAHTGSRYRFALPDGRRVADPASRFQPSDVAGPSEVIDPTLFRWSDGAWAGRPWHEAVLYELHIGTFTPEGTFHAAIGRLSHLAGLGVTAIELMPVADFPGGRNWGYDGVLPFAPDSAYGRPDDLKALVDAAHALGLMVFLDVVYNHFGPEGNDLPGYAPQMFTDRHRTPWGAAINVDGPESPTVRDFFIHNALYWIGEFRIDGLRLDAVHAILDDSAPSFVEELATRVRAQVGGRRHIHLVLENDDNRSSPLDRAADGSPRCFTAQWNDDLHHALHVAATGETTGYYADYRDAVTLAGRALAEGFAYQGDSSGLRGGTPRGDPSGHLPPTAFVAFLQNHDQIGNRALGERIAALAPEAAVRAVSAMFLLAPSVPMLFMGQEWASASPFLFFCDFAPDLAQSVRDGRTAEFATFPAFADAGAQKRIPDPTREATWRMSCLDWDNLALEPHARWLDWHRRILAVRRDDLVPHLAGMAGGDARWEVVDGRGLRVRWSLAGGCVLHLAANPGDGDAAGFAAPAGRVLWREGEGLRDDGILSPWSVIWSLEEPSDLDRLAAAMGIEDSYGAAGGHTVRAAPAVKRSLLKAMGIDAPDEAAAAAALAMLERDELGRPLPPVAVLRVDSKPFAVPVTFPAGTSELYWRLEEEEGGSREGAVLFADLPLLRRAALDAGMVEVRRLDLCPAGTAPPVPGYHRLVVTSEGASPQSAETWVIAVPDRCHLPGPLEAGGHLWGMSCQLYALRSATDWGMGSFGELRSLVEIAAARGASVVGLNPLHALFLDEPGWVSPYSPASRLFLNPLYIDVAAIPELMADAAARERLASPEFQEALAAARAAPLIDSVAVTRLKLPMLEGLYVTFCASATAARREDFDAFRYDGGPTLERFCVFQALREMLGGDWRGWPVGLRDPQSGDVAGFAGENAGRISFFAWLQWVADGQLAAVAARARQRGLTIGLYRDLAVGGDPAGAETWSSPQVVVSAAHVGAPPDLFNPSGQDWGLPPLHPRALRETAYASFIELVRANMRHAGALRIDHAMALRHVYWVPEGQSPADGAYVASPLEDLLGILALESQRHRCLVVGEDLGTVPAGFRERMTAAGVLSCRVVFFEWAEDGGFIGPDAYPYLAVATVGSHDLATLRGWWEGRDIALKERHGLYPDADEAGRQKQRRADERGHLLKALVAADLVLPAGVVDAGSPWVDALGHVVHVFLARTEAAIAMVQLEDLAGEAEQVNLPGTIDEEPNWRRKLAKTLETLADDTGATTLTNILAAARPPVTAKRARPPVTL